MAKSQKQLLAEVESMLPQESSIGSNLRSRAVGYKQNASPPIDFFLESPSSARKGIGRRAPGTQSVNRKNYCASCDKYYTDKQALFHNH